MQIQKTKEKPNFYGEKNTHPNSVYGTGKGVSSEVTKYLGCTGELNLIRDEVSNFFQYFIRYGVYHSARAFLRSPLLSNDRYVRFFKYLNYFIVKKCKRGTKEEQELRQTIPLIRDFVERLKNRNNEQISAFKVAILVRKIGFKHKKDLNNFSLTENIKQKMIKQAREEGNIILSEGLQKLVTPEFLEQCKDAIPVLSKLDIFTFERK